MADFDKFFDNLDDSPARPTRAEPETPAIPFDAFFDSAAAGDPPRGVGSIKASGGTEPTFGNVLRGLKTDLVEGGVRAREGARMQFSDALGLEDMNGDAALRWVQSKSRNDLATPEIQDPTLRAAYGGVSSLLRSLPGLAASIALRSPTPALGAAGVQTQLEAYGKYRTRDVEPSPVKVPAGDRQQIVEALRSRNKPVTEAEVQRLYVKVNGAR